MDRITASLVVVFLTTSVVVTASGQQPPPLQEKLFVVGELRHLPMTSTPDEELQRLSEVGDAIAVIEVTSSPGELTPLRDGAGIKVRGTVKDGVKASDRAALWASDGTIEFEFGGSDSGASGEYPILKAGERYLIFFDLHPFITRWYPALPFRVDDAGRLAQVDWVQREPLGWKSPINGLSLDEVVNRLRKKQ